MVAESSSQIKEAIVRYRELTAEESIRAMYERREKARRDYISDMNWAKKSTALSIAEKLIQTDLPLETIIAVTGLTREEVEGCATEKA